jgi:hypothetical protein
MHVVIVVALEERVDGSSAWMHACLHGQCSFDAQLSHHAQIAPWVLSPALVAPGCAEVRRQEAFAIPTQLEGLLRLGLTHKVPNPFESAHPVLGRLVQLGGEELVDARPLSTSTDE